MRNKKHIVNECLTFMEDYDNAELPDGAWQAMLIEGVKVFNEYAGANLDPLDMFLAYVEKNGTST